MEVRAAFQKKWDADYGQEKATAGVLRFYGLTFKLMSCVLIAAAALLYLAGQISRPYCLTFLFCAFTVYSDLETMGNSAFLSKRSIRNWTGWRGHRHSKDGYQLGETGCVPL